MAANKTVEATSSRLVGAVKYLPRLIPSAALRCSIDHFATPTHKCEVSMGYILFKEAQKKSAKGVDSGFRLGENNNPNKNDKTATGFVRVWNE